MLRNRQLLARPLGARLRRGRCRVAVAVRVDVLAVLGSGEPVAVPGVRHDFSEPTVRVIGLGLKLG